MSKEQQPTTPKPRPREQTRSLDILTSKHRWGKRLAEGWKLAGRDA